MFLRIQKDESISSYIARNLFINGGESDFEWMRDIHNRLFRNDVLNRVAEIHGWPGVYGFNRVLHYHTSHPLIVFVKNELDFSYSNLSYDPESPQRYETWEASYCPQCVKEDLDRTGCSYWRRELGLLGPQICARHNLVRLKTCPFCKKPFGRGGHHLDVMWKGCGGRGLEQARSEKNDDPRALKMAQLCEEILCSDFHISGEAAVRALKKRLSQGVPDPCDANTLERVTDITSKLSLFDDTVESRWGYKNSYWSERSSEIILSLIFELYSSYSEFFEDVKIIPGALRGIKSLWSTYKIDSIYMDQWVEEDYKHGVGLWSVGSSEWEYYGRMVQDPRPLILSCCNDQLSFKNRQMTPRKITRSAPFIPKLSTSALDKMRADIFF